MKNNHFKHILSTFTNIICILVFVLFNVGSIYFYSIIQKTPTLNVANTVRLKSSKIYDNQDHFIKQLVQEDYEDITYEDLPDIFIHALLSCEDVRYFLHNGIDLPRLLVALKNNATTLSFKEGASTLTQQLIKNMMLSNKKSLERKIQEAYLSLNIERLYSKKDILEFYCNFVCFDGSNHGIQAACYRYLNKSVRELTLPEAALMAGIGNLPTAYNPILHPEAANNRKNTVLSLMVQHGYLSQQSAKAASQIHVRDLLYPFEDEKEEAYPYQAYIDVVYQQIVDKTGLDPYTTPMEIYTNMDVTLQSEIDAIQENKSSYLHFNHPLQQLGACIIKNKTGAIVGVFGGRNYKGQKLYNRAIHMKKQPASTIKVVLDYALAFEYLSWSNKQTVLDIKTNYPNSQQSIKNVDNQYYGEISIADAIGFSRNTTAVLTLQEVISKVGVNTVTNYLKDLNLLDVLENQFNYSYALGGFTYGVTPIDLAAAYSMLARGGNYIEPLAIRKIKLLDGSQKEIVFTPIQKKLLDERSCFLLTQTLLQVMEANNWSIQDVRPDHVALVAKTGTSSFDASTLQAYHIPNGASKDRWIAGYSVDYAMAIWSGFDELVLNQKTYFYGNDDDSLITKKIFRRMMDILAEENLQFSQPNGLNEVNIVKGSNNLLANTLIDDAFIDRAFFKIEDTPKTFFEEPMIQEKVEFDFFTIQDQLNIIIKPKEKQTHYKLIYDIDKIMGGKSIIIDIYHDGMYEQSIQTIENVISFPLKKGLYHLEIYYQYQNSYLSGPKQILDFYL